MAIPLKSMKQTANIAKQIAKNGAVITDVNEMYKYTGGPELGHISLEYLFASNILPLGTIIHLFGPEGCGKSTMAMHFLDEYFMKQGGDGHIIDTEGKMSIPVIKSIVDPESLAEDKFTIYRSGSLESAQSVVTTLTKELAKATFDAKKKERVPHLLGAVIDSFRVTSEITQKGISDDGHASKQFAVEAALWRTFLSTMAPKMLYMPMALFLVNHMTEKESSTGWGKVKDHGGGQALKYHISYSFLLQRIASVSNKSNVYADLSIQSYKNSGGEGKLKIFPRIVYQSPDLEQDRFRIDWDIADAKLLAGPDVPRDALKSAGICAVKESSKAGLYSDEVLGLSCVPIQEITQKIYSEPDRLKALREQLKIYKYQNLEELWESGWLFDARHSVTGADDE